MNHQEQSQELVLKDISLEQLKEYISKWIEVDNIIKQSFLFLKQKKQEKEILSNIISSFMIKYDIEDINLKNCKIRCKTSASKTPITTKIVKDKIFNYLQVQNDVKQRVLEQLEMERKAINKVSLRKLKIS